jgi:hypothetical protein
LFAVFVASEGEEFEVFFVVFVALMVFDDEVVGSEEDASGAAGGVGNGFEGLGSDALNHCPDQGEGGEVLTCSAFGVFGIFSNSPS